MFMFVIQSALLILIAFVLGCIVGSLICRWLTPASTSTITKEPEALREPAPAPAASSKMAAKPKPAVKSKPAPAKKPVEKKPAAKKPVVKKKAAPKPKAPATKDNLKEIKGIGPQNELRLNNDGTTTFAQIAKWSAKQQKEIGERLAFPGRIERENWVAQAKVLAKGGDTEFSKRVARGEVSSSKGRAKK